MTTPDDERERIRRERYPWLFDTPEPTVAPTPVPAQPVAVSPQATLAPVNEEREAIRQQRYPWLFQGEVDTPSIADSPQGGPSFLQGVGQGIGLSGGVLPGALEAAFSPFQALTGLVRQSGAGSVASFLPTAFESAPREGFEQRPGAGAFERTVALEQAQPLLSQLLAGLLTDPSIALGGAEISQAGRALRALPPAIGRRARPAVTPPIRRVSEAERGLARSRQTQATIEARAPQPVPPAEAVGPPPAQAVPEEVPVQQAPEALPPPQVIREAGDAQLAKFPVERQGEVRAALLAADDATHTQAFQLFESSKARTLRGLPREAEDAYDSAWQTLGIEPPPRESGFLQFELENTLAAGQQATPEQIAALPRPQGAGEAVVPPGGGGQSSLFSASDLPPVIRNKWQEARELTNIPRALLATGDLSATLRQGGVLAYGHPTRASKTFGTVLKNSFSEEASENLILAMKQSPDYERFILDRDVGLHFSDQLGEFSRREELFANQTLQKVPGLGPVVKFSERNYVNYLNKLRLDVMGDVVRGWERGGQKASKTELRQLAQFINHATGRGDLGFLQKAGPELTAAFFAPRFALSRPQLVWDFMKLANPHTSWRVRRTIAKDLTSFVTINSMILSMLAAVPGVTVGTNYLANDFGMVRIGKTRYDFWAGNQQFARMVIQILRGKRATSSGREIPQPISETVERYLRSKLSPVGALVPDVATPLTRRGLFGDDVRPTDFLGREIKTDPKSLFTEVLKRTVPLTVQDIWDAGREEGLSNAPKGAPAVLGIGVNTFATFDEQVSAKGAEVGIPDGDLWPHEKRSIGLELRGESDRQASGYGLRIETLNGEEAEILLDIAGNRDVRRTQQEKVNAYFDIVREYGIRRNEAAQSLLGDPDFTSTEDETDPQKRALAEYYDFISNTPPGLFGGDQWERDLRRLENQWRRQGALDYVLATQNDRDIPPSLLRILPSGTKARIRRSEQARDRRRRQYRVAK